MTSTSLPAYIKSPGPSPKDGPVLFPAIRQKKIPYIAVFNALTTHVRLIHGNDILRVMVANTVIKTKLPLSGLLLPGFVLLLFKLNPSTKLVKCPKFK